MTASVTGCSTWMRPFSSRKKKSPPSRTNSAVPALRYEIARAKRPPPRSSPRAAPSSAGGATPPAPSGGGAGPSTRARRARSPLRPVAEQLDLDVAGPLEVALAEHGVVAERRLRLPPAASSAPSSSTAERTTRMPRPPPPAAAFTSSGNRARRVALGSTGTPAFRAVRFAASLSPPARSASGAGRRRSVPPPRPPPRSPRSRPGSRTRGGSRRRRSPSARGCAPPSGGSDGSRPSRPRPRVQRPGVVRRRDRHRRDPELAAGAEDAHRDLAAVRDQELPDRHPEGEYGLCRRAPGRLGRRGERGWRRACGSRSRRARSRPACGRGRTSRSAAAWPLTGKPVSRWKRVGPAVGAGRRLGRDRELVERRRRRVDERALHGAAAGRGDVEADDERPPSRA